MKTKFGSKEVEPGVSVNNFVADFLAKHLDDYLHKHAETAQILQRKIVENEKERKAISGIQKKARETAKKVSLNNKKLRDCKIHRTDTQRAGRTVDDLHHGGQLGVGFDHQEPRRAYAGGLLAARQAAELLRADEEGGLRERGVQPPSGGAEHRGGHGQPALQQGRHRHRCRCRRHAHPPA